MRDMKEINSKVMWINDKKSDVFALAGMKMCYIELPTKVRAHVVVGFNEDGWEHVSMELFARRLPTWEEMCYVKDIFWDDEEEVVQIHPKKSKYVNMTEALHMWRPCNGDWSLMNKG